MDRDVEAGFGPQVTPKTNATSLGGPIRQRASIPRLLVASMPRMVTTMAMTAQVIAMVYAAASVSPTLINVLGLLMNLIMSPIVGSLSDHSTNKYGRRRSFLIFSTLAVVLVLFLSCLIPDISRIFGGYDSVPYLAVIFYVLTASLINFIDVPCMLLVADLAGDRQVTGAALGQGWSILGSVFVSVYFKLFGDISSHGSFDAVCCVLMLIIITIVGYNISETPREPSEATPAAAPSSAFIVYRCILVLIGYGVYNYTTNRLLFFETRVESDSEDDYYYSYNSDSGLGDFKYFIIQQTAAYIFTWMLPFLTNKFGATTVISVSFIPQALLVIMAFVQSKTLVGLMDFAVTIFRGTVFVMIVPAVVHVYGASTNIGVHVGFLSSIESIGSLAAIAIGSSVLHTDMGVQLPVLLAGVVGIICVFTSNCLALHLKSL